MLTLGVVVAFLAAIVATFWWLLAWTREKKTWCVILYHVSRDSNATFQWPTSTGVPTNDALDLKLDQVVGDIEAIPSANALTWIQRVLFGQQASPGGVNWDDVHVVYRALWNPHPIRPNAKPTARARVVSWRPNAPSWPDDTSFETPTADDRDGFFLWAYDNCPADHYAVFFWGHSIGPGGLFKLSNSVAFPPLPATVGWTTPASLIEVEATIRLLFDRRNDPYATTTFPAGVPPGTGVGTAPSGSPPPPPPPTVGATAQKIEIVFFQDCWMSTLETAFELKKVARYVVGSQSLVPIGYQYDSNNVFVDPLGPVWPYTELLTILLSNPNQFAAPILVALQTFFDQQEANRLPNILVPFSLMDLGLGDEITVKLTPPLQQLVQELAPLRKSERRLLFDGNSIVKFKNNNPNDVLQAGEYALVDVLKLCTFLSQASSYATFNPPNAQKIRDAAGDIIAIVTAQPVGSVQYSLVKQLFESPSVGGAAHLGFNGVSALWIPGTRIATPAGDPYIADQIQRSFYQNLKFVSETAMPSSGVSWADYAFEQKT